MKQRFSSLDLQVIAHELSATLTNYRLANIYDLTSRIFLLKFAKPESKHLLLIDSGFRCHLTSFSRATATTPSSFVAKLRKCLRTRRVTSVRQLGTDRVLALQFSAGEFTLYLEFYAGGNVVLVGKDGVVVAVLRVVKGVGECKVGAKYEVSDRVAGGDLKTRVVEALETGVGGEDVEAVEAQAQVSGKKFKKKKKKKEDAVRKVLATRMPEFSPTLVEHCLRIVGVDPEIKAEEALADEAKVDLIVKAFEEAEKLVKDVMVDKDGTGIKGYIIAKQPRQHTEPVGGYKRGKGVSFGPSQSSKEVSSSGPSEPSKGVSFGPTDTPKDIVFGAREAVEEEQQVEKIQEDGEAQGMVYSDFFPFLPIQFATDPSVKCLPFTGFNHTVDTFFSSIESQKLTSRIVERELAATKRLADAHASHARRVEGLRDMQELNVLKAKAIEANLDRVEEVIAAVNGLVAQGMDWAAMGHLIDGEKKRGNPVAELIKLPLKLFENTVTITLGEEGAADDSDDESAAGSDDGSDDNNNNDDDDDGEEAPKKSPTETLDIDIDLSLTAYANASLYFTQKKSLLAKESKTLQSSSKALKSTSRKIAADLRKGLKQEKELLCPVRPAVWFEKFLFFISSDGYLVLAGRDLQQNEILYKRYFRRGDVFVSADEQGAAVVLVRNNSSIAGAPVPPGTLGQAGTLAVATSTAWERKSAVAAWWVAYEQVRKTAAGGDYLPPGVFDVSGKKNYLPPAQLVLGYGVLWMVDEEGRKRHGKHRMEEGEKAAPDDVEGKQPDGEEDGEKREDNSGSKAEETSSGLKTEEQKGEEEEDDEDEDEEEDEEDSDDEEFPDTRIESAGEEEEEEEAEVKHAPGTESDDEGSPGADLKYQESDPAAVAVSGGKQTTAPPPDTSAHPSGSKHLTAKARRDLKKARISGTSTPNSAHNTPAAASTAHSKHPVLTSAPEPARVRGKKGKQKKQATKYAHQDAEDRALAMEVLGSASAAAKTASAAAAAATREAELTAQKARRREQHARAAREGLKAEEARRREAPEEEEEEPEEPVPLDCFVGTPMVGDNILAAIPVCAPWGAMGTFKYKAKMQPGSVKKGKAVKDVVARWLTEAEKKMDLSSTDMEKAWPRETELVKSWKEAEIINCVGVSKVKVFGGGAASSGRSAGGKRGGRGGKRK